VVVDIVGGAVLFAGRSEFGREKVERGDGVSEGSAVEVDESKVLVVVGDDGDFSRVSS
jgi:hypothetical protein